MLRKIERTAFCAAILALVLAAPGVTLAQDETCEIVKLSGEVKVNGKPAEPGMKVRKGDRIETADAESAFVDLSSGRGHVVRLRQGRMDLKNISDKFELGMDKGRLFVHAAQLSARQSFKIHTPAAVAGVRGTKFFLSSSKEESYLCVCEGKVSAARKGAIFGKEIVVSAGQDAHLKPGRKFDAPVESPMMVKMTWDEFKDMGFNKP